MNQQQFKRSPQQPQQSPLQPEQPPTGYPPYQGSPTYQPGYIPSQPNGEQSQWSLQAEQASICRLCGKELSFLDRVGLDKKNPRCRTCRNQVHQSLNRFRTTFLELTRYDAFSNTDWTTLQHRAVQEHLDFTEALSFISKDVVALVARIVAGAEVRGSITNDIEQIVSHLLRTFLIPNDKAQQIYQRLARSKQRINIQLLDRAVSQAETEGELTDETENRIYHLQATLAIPNELAQPILQRLVYFKQRTHIQRFQRAMAQVEANGDVTEEAEQYILYLHKTLRDSSFINYSRELVGAMISTNHLPK